MITLRRSALLASFLAVCAAAPLPAQVTRQPYLQCVAPTSVVVRWDTGTPEVGTVQYGTSPSSLGFSAVDTAVATKHEVTLHGLSPETKYYYSVAGPAGGREDQYVVTAPTAGSARDTRIWVVSDFGQDNTAAHDVRRGQTVAVWKSFNGNSLHTDFMLSLGDQTEDDTDEELQENYFNHLQDVVRNTPLFTIPGNHEGHDGEVSYKAAFSNPAGGEAGGVPSGTEDYYSVTYGNVHVVGLTGENGVSIPGPQTTWLQTDLANNHSDWLIAIMHNPMHSAGAHKSDGSPYSLAEKKNWLPLLEAAGVDLILAGHNHVYERSYLLDSLVGTSFQITQRNKIDTTLGPYRKKAGQPHAGTIFITCQAAGTANGEDDLRFPFSFFPVIFRGDTQEGSLVIDVHGRDSLNVRFLCDEPDSLLSHVWDRFTIIKQYETSVPGHRAPGIPYGISITSYPNPFNPTTRIAYDLPHAGPARLVIVDLLGRVVATLVDGVQNAGTHTLEWSAVDNRGVPLPGGIYIARIQSGTAASSHKLTLVR